MKKWKKVKKSYLAAFATGLLVLGAGIIVLVNASGLNSIFEPKDFEHFENQHEDGDDYDSAAGDGNESDLADENEDGDNDKDEKSQRALQAEADDSKNQNHPGLADNQNRAGDSGQERNPDAFEVSDGRGPGGIDVTPGGTNNGNTGDINGENPGNGDNGDEPNIPGKPDQPGTPTGPDNPEYPSGPSSWEEDQLKPRDPVQTENGILVRLSASIHRDYYQGDVFRGEDATVTATFRQPDGRNQLVTLPYGEPDGYSVRMSTRVTGKHTATFTYMGVSARAAYEVISSGVTVRYYGISDDRIFALTLPGPLGYDSDTMKELSSRTYTYYAVSGGTADLTDIHSRLIAYLGDGKVKESFLEDNGYKRVVFLEEEDGYLKSMLTGFQYYSNGALEEREPCLYYPVANWGTGSLRTVMDIVGEVPAGYRIRRVVQDEDDPGKFKGSQVLEQYTGNSPVMEIPMGVTDIELKGMQGDGSTKITTLALPESVRGIEFASIGRSLPTLTDYETAGNGVYQAIDGVLYSKDGCTLLSVPPGKTDIVIPDTVTTIAQGAFQGSSIRELRIPETVTSLNEGCFRDFAGELIRMDGGIIPDIPADTGYTGKVLFADSAYDVLMKKGIFAFKSQDIVFGAMDGDGTEIAGKTDIYTYDDKRNILTMKDEPDILAGINPGIYGYYAVPDGITAVSGGAFAGADGVREISLPDTLKELRQGSLVLPAAVEEVSLSADRMTISPMLFGDSAQGAAVPDIRVCVPKEYYEGYLEAWQQALDPVYGAGTAERLLQIRDDTIFYEDEAKYQKITEGGVNGYRLLEVYAQNRTSFRVKDGTMQILAGAFARSERLEILYLPDSLKRVENSAFSGCAKLETVTVKSEELLEDGVFDSLAGQVNVYDKGSGFEEFIYDKGIVYGKSSEGIYTLIDVPTDYSADVEVYKNTGYLNTEAFRNCTLAGKIEITDQASLREIGDRCFENCTAVRSIHLDNAVRLERIGDEAFRSCTGLEKLYLADSIKELGKGMCYDCTSLQVMSAKGVKKVGTEAFYNCQSLLAGSITLDWNQMTELGDQAFAYCSLLTALPDMPALQSLGIRTFFSCQRLKRMTLPETLSSMGEECFGECGALTQVEMKGRLTGISRYCFYGCRELVKVEFSEQQQKALQVIGVEAFGQCTSLESLDLSQFPLLTQMGERTFEGCDFLTAVKFPENLKKVPDYCFENCPNLSILTLVSAEVTGLGEAIFGDALSPFVHIWVKEENLLAYVNAYKDILDRLYGEGTAASILGKIDEKTEIVRGITFEITDEGRVLKEASEAFEGTYTVPVNTIRIETEAFAGCQKLTGIVLPGGSQIILGDRCFKGCIALEEADLLGDIPKWGDESFMDCTALRKVCIGEGYQESIPRIGTRAFAGCSGLNGRDAVSIRAKVTVLGEECFANCVNLSAIPTTESARVSLEVIEDRAFSGCKSMTQFLTSAFPGMRTIGSQAFYDCDSLNNPSVPENVTSIGEGCFAECDNLTTVSFYCALEEYPKDCFKNCSKLTRTGGVADALSGLKRIGEGAYEGCTSLVTNDTWNLGRYSQLEEIGVNAFRGCISMTEIALPSTVQRIREGAFDGCRSAGQMILSSVTIPQIGKIALDTMSDAFVIRVPDSQAEGDSVYKGYLAVFTEMFGESKAYEILDSISDSAKERNPLPASADSVSVGEPQQDEEAEEICEEIIE